VNRAIIPPHDPKQPEPVRPPMVYIERPARWEYKQILRNLETETPPDEEELNKLGEDGWEMSGVTQKPPFAYFYFKRLTER
jgi:hypothetical protein